MAVICEWTARIGVATGAAVGRFPNLVLRYALGAIVPHAIDRLHDPVWRRASDLLGLDLLPHISGRAEISPTSIGHFLLFLTFFLSGFFAGFSRRNAVAIVWFAQDGNLSVSWQLLHLRVRSHSFCEERTIYSANPWALILAPSPCLALTLPVVQIICRAVSRSCASSREIIRVPIPGCADN